MAMHSFLRTPSNQDLDDSPTLTSNAEPEESIHALRPLRPPLEHGASMPILTNSQSLKLIHSRSARSLGVREQEELLEAYTSEVKSMTEREPMLRNRPPLTSEEFHIGVIHGVKYDESWLRRRSAYIFFIICLMLCTVVLVMFLLVPRTFTCTLQLGESNVRFLLSNTTNATRSVSITATINAEITNTNYVPLNIDKYEVNLYFLCSNAKTSCIIHLPVYSENVDVTEAKEAKVQKQSKHTFSMNVHIKTSNFEKFDALWTEYKNWCPKGENSSQSTFTIEVAPTLHISYSMKTSDTWGSSDGSRYYWIINCDGKHAKLTR